ELRYAAQAPLSPKFDHVGDGAKPSRATTPSSGAGHHFCQHSSMAMLLIGRRLSQEKGCWLSSNEVGADGFSLPKLKPTRAEGHKRLISPLIRSPRPRARAGSAALLGRAPWRS